MKKTTMMRRAAMMVALAATTVSMSGQGTFATLQAPAAHGGTAAVWYMLDGRRLTGRSAEGRLQGKKPAQRGIYIYNSKKVVVK